MRPLPTTLLLAALFAPAARGGELRNFDDAALHAVQFMPDGAEGWAVGDDGVIWHTIDGGDHWERQPSGVRASLRSLHFLNPYTGWVAGREELPGGGSAGVLLYTRDGGIRWRRVLLGALPGLNQVRFADPKTGYLVGDGADQYPTGVFVTHDTGKTWQPVPGPRCPSWLAADFDAVNGGALAGVWNRAATVRRDRVFLAETDLLGGRSLRGVQLRDRDAVAVGQGGLVLLSRGTQGSTWDFVRLNLPGGAEMNWDLHAVGGVGRHVWAAGRPGSAALHSPDLGRTWEVVRTGQPLPLNGLFFLDEKRGWMVGELGTVLATADGGKTWRAQKRGGERAAVLFVHARAAGAPLDTVAMLGGEEGYLTAGLRVTAPDAASAAPARAAEASRFGAAMRQAGGAAGEMLWQFPVGSHLAAAGRDDLLRAWDQLHGDRTADQLLRQLVLAIRTWRPAVLVTDAARGDGVVACDGLVAEAVREAFRRAEDPAAYPEQLSVLGLETWKPVKLYARCEGRRDAQVTLDLAAVLPRLEASVQEFAAGPAELLAPGAAVPAERRYHLLASRRPGAEADQALMQGVDLPPGGLARRLLERAEEMTPQALKAARQRANLRALVEAPAGGLGAPGRVLAQIGPMLADMPDDQAVRAAYSVAVHYARVGQWTLAREAFLLVAERYPAHPLAADACRWLVRYNSSSEARRRTEMGQFIAEQLQVFGLPTGKTPLSGPVIDPNVIPAGLGAKPQAKGAKPQAKTSQGGQGKEPGKFPDLPRVEALQETHLQLLGGVEEARAWYRGSLALESRLEAFGPLFANDPGVQFCLQAARRNLGDVQTPRKWYSEFTARHSDGPWRGAAAAELWLMDRKGPCPRPVLRCRNTEERPFLDGKLDDACWRGPAVPLHDAVGKTEKACPTEVRLAYDNEFLYVAARCVRPAGAGAGPAKERPRDADLHGHDRVSLMLDLDRDYATYYHLQIDERGCVCEDCWGDKTWNPRWFVAVRQEAGAWTAEAAIPLVALTGDTIIPGRAWAANVVRVLPGRGVQAWSLPAEVPDESPRPEGMGLMLFGQDAAGAAMPPAR